MSFLAVLIAMLLEQTRPVAPDNPVHAALRGWSRWVRRSLDAGQTPHGVIVWAMAVALPTVAVAMIHVLLWSYSAILTFVWAVATLYLTVGFRQFSHHFTHIRDLLERGDDAGARQALADWQGVPVGELPQSELLRHVIEHAVLAAHKHVLGVLVCFAVFWALGLGPAGAVLYRLADYLAETCRSGRQNCPSAQVCQHALRAWQLVNHIPARATALAFAIAGNFEEAVASWRQDAGRFADANNGVVLAATAGALNVRLGGRPLALPAAAVNADDAAAGGDSATWSPDTNALGREPQLAHLASLVGLVWRSVVLWMFLLALLTLARLMG